MECLLVDLAIVNICRKLYISTHLGVAGIFFYPNFLIESGLVFYFLIL